MNPSHDSSSETTLPTSMIARRLIDRATAWASAQYGRNLFSIDPTLILEPAGNARTPYFWTMSQAGHCDNDPIQQTIPVSTKDRFGTFGRMISLSLNAQAAVFVSEMWIVLPKQRPGESNEEMTARLEAETRDGLGQHPDREERLMMVLEWIEGGEIHHHPIFWKIVRQNGKARIGPMDSDIRKSTQGSGRFSHWICPNQPVPEQASATVRMLLQFYGVKMTASSC